MSAEDHFYLPTFVTRCWVSRRYAFQKVTTQTPSNACRVKIPPKNPYHDLRSSVCVCACRLIQRQKRLVKWMKAIRAVSSPVKPSGVQKRGANLGTIIERSAGAINQSIS